MGKLHAKGIKLAVATSKPRVFAQKILEKYSMQDDFDLVCGSEFNGERGQKWEVIEYALEQFGISPDEAIMVGDRKYDVIGAKKCGVECIGVRFGYAEPGELEREGAVYVAENADDLFESLRQKGPKPEKHISGVRQKEINSARKEQTGQPASGRRIKR